MKNKPKQTAVEWLMEIDKRTHITIEEWQHAKEMEKEQIMSAYNNCELYNPEQYYNETYGIKERCRCGNVRTGNYICLRTDCNNYYK